ncbi:MAG: hypothetical protein ACRDYC_01365, partial [Acidimicrobiales bacterium]
LGAGDVITAVGASPIASDQQLTAALLAIQAFTTLQVVYADPSGRSHTVSVTLGAYPTQSLNAPPPTVFEL